jgi:hypothetical protein
MRAENKSEVGQASKDKENSGEVPAFLTTEAQRKREDTETTYFKL